MAGTRVLSSFTFKTAGTRTITATDAAATLTANTSASVTVNAGAVTKLQILLPGEVAAPGTATHPGRSPSTWRGSLRSHLSQEAECVAARS